MTQHVIPGTSHIIPTRNRPQFVAASVEAVLAGDSVPAELIVVDQSASPHPTLRDRLTGVGTELRYIWEPARGLSRARNTGIRAARHETVSFTDDDIVVPAAWFGSLIDGLRAAGDRAAATGPVLAIGEDRRGAFAPSTSSIEDRTTERTVIHAGLLRRDVLNGGNMATTCVAFREVGLFDERLGAGARFPGAEDNDFGFRLLRAGYRISFVPTARVDHRAWRTAGAYLPLRWKYARGQGAFFAKHLGRYRRTMVQRLGRAMRGHFLAIRWQLPGEPLKAIGSIVYVFGLLAGVIEWLLTQPPED